MPESPLTITDAAARLRDGTTTSVELTSSMLAVADQLDPLLGTYISRYDDTALEAAAAADAELASGLDRGPLHGIPLGVKDIIACKEGPTTAQSVVYDPAWWAGRDAPVVERLREAGMVVVGKTTTPTPKGHFFLEEKVRQASSSVLGPWALATSAFSTVLQEFGGSPGQVALHGRAGELLNDPLGTAASHGCIRFENRVIRELASLLPNGTPIDIR